MKDRLMRFFFLIDRTAQKRFIQMKRIIADIKQMSLQWQIIFRRNVRNSVKQEFLIVTDDFSNSSSIRFGAEMIWCNLARLPLRLHQIMR